MSTSLDEAEAALRSGHLADLGHLLKEGGRQELAREIARLQGDGLQAHVLILPAGEELTPLHSLWDRLKYDPGRDLMLLFNGRRWEARGWNLSASAVQAALAAAEPARRQYFGRGLAVALAGLGQATGRKAQPEAARSSSGSIIVGVGGLVAASAIGWVLVRRGRRSAERRRALSEARASADRVFAEVLLGAEELSSPEGLALQEKASRLKNQIDTLVPPNLKQLPAKEEDLTMARLRQMENELEALRSGVLQLKRRP
jgi:hypothetical protein